MLTLRAYQREAIDALYAYWQDAGGGNGLIVLPTGAGKSLVIATLVRELIEAYPTLRIGVVTHVKELIGQNAQEILRIWPGAPIGIYSAGLGKRDAHSQVLFMGIQSVHNKARTLGKFDILLVDEAHLIPRNSDTMYGRFIKACREIVPDMRLVGLTATPFRLDSGRLDKGSQALFDDIVFEASVADLIDGGFLSPLLSKRGTAEIDTKGVSVRGGEFSAGDLERAASAPGVVESACVEIVELGRDRHGWLAFCSGVLHATQVRDELRRLGATCETITGDTPAGERDAIIRRYKQREIRCLTSVGVLTTGFNAPHVDLIAMLRPTLSTGLYVQMVGRGFRLAPGKDDCLVLDFAGNVRRHGPVDEVRAPGSKKGKVATDDDERGKVKADTVRAKECPSCEGLNSLNALKCSNPHCDYEWPKPEPKHTAAADTEAAILSRDQDRVPKWTQVRETLFFEHRKIGKPTSLRVEYMCGLASHREWLCFEHSGFARDKAGQTWRRLGGEHPVPRTVGEALRRVGELDRVNEIAVRAGADGFMEIVGRRTRPWEPGERPVYEPSAPAKTGWHEVLGVGSNAERHEIENAYRAQAKKAHPDCGGSHEAMLALNAAREAALADCDLREF